MKINKQRLLGFTLLEVIIVVAILGILAAIAFPSYRRYVLEVNRDAAIAQMNDIGQWLERSYTNNNGAYPANYPNTTIRGYVIRVNIVANRQSYAITARPDASQSKDVCGVLTINSDGNASSNTGRTDCFR